MTPQLLEQLERQLALLARALRDPVVLTDGTVVPRSTASLLVALAEREPARVGEVSAALDLDPSTTTRQVQHAIRLGLVARVVAQDDRRVVLLSLTPAGRDLHDTLARRQRQNLHRVLDGWPDQDQHDLVRLMTLLATRVGELRAERPSRARTP
ncbi:MarR family winged helix-turn-helix transcriptional regulator [Nocardioides sp. CFH 31398]|uniref:MarR family winged helix-turn-helix transcriptional regulator n=1 Tax=Nocardioides sp. CFH 31398 TaxID=2919579 RepID=UPI001F054CE7|nr:MarR family transcriptional regulator [Nocardioides sp. CFH 31398]MCH1865279.1 MarR family transcriptional regulator [Nocardioides sp. CFH 31398]